jgi:hypothetical protein
LGGRIVSLDVGPHPEIYAVHEDLLCEHSPFFQAAVKEEWREPHDRIPLPHDDPDVVCLYLHWTYAGRILSRKSDSTNEESDNEINFLVDAFIFGEKVQDSRFKDAVIDAAIKSTLSSDMDGVPCFPGVMAVNRAYKGTPPGSPLRRLMIDLWARHGRDTWEREDLNGEFLTELVGELLASRDTPLDSHPTDGKTSTCSYHHHGGDHPCYNEGKNT